MRRLRAEWERQRAVMMAFPHEGTDWAVNGGVQSALSPFVRLAQAIAYREAVYILCRDRREIEGLFCSRRNMTFIEIDYDDTWTRDYGPLSVEEDGEPLLLDFRFDGWGGKYRASLDDAVNRTLHDRGYFGTTPMHGREFVLEGGSIESDGAGTIMTTARCLLNPNRNGGLSREEVERELSESLGAKRVLWLENGYLAGDDTDGHIDMLARFADEKTILYLSCDDEEDEHYTQLKAMREELESFETAEGEPYRLIPLPMCAEARNDDGERLPLSYANFLVCNGTVVYPTYGDPSDRVAGEILASAFPGRETIPVPSLKLTEQGGSLHCSTMQIYY